MVQQMLMVALLLLPNFSKFTWAGCDAHSPAFPLPKLSPSDKEIRKAYSKIQSEIQQAVKDSIPADVSFSVAVTSEKKTLFELHHTATDRDEHRPGVLEVDGSSVYRIASITKSFTALALLQLQKAGKLGLDDPVNRYLPELEEHQTGSLPWKDITLRTLATQLSGLPRNVGMGDLGVTDKWQSLGLPSFPEDGIDICDSLWNYTRPCTSNDLYGFLRKAEPLFAPKQQSTYSNVNYDILGLVIEKVSGTKYVDYIQKTILDELHLPRTTFSPTDDSISVLPKGQAKNFDEEFDVQNPTGGLFSTSDDMMKWARYILTHYNGLSPVVNWLQPQSFSTGTKSFYGMPWEIFRTEEILPYTRRPVTFVNKSGGWPGYSSVLTIIPEYGIGIVVLVGLSDDFTDLPNKLIGIVGQHIVEAADSVAQRQASENHIGTYIAPDRDINSSITISHSDAKGIYISSWISNSIDVLKGHRDVFMGGDMETPMHLQLVPTLLFKNETQKAGEIWRTILVEGHNPSKIPYTGPLNKDFCVTDIDYMAFRGKSVKEVVFWEQDQSGAYNEIELPGWRIRMQKTSEGVVQRLVHSAQNALQGKMVLQDWFQSIQRD